MKVLLSIKPEFAHEIFLGTKRYEYRKTIFRQKVKGVVVYASSPVSKVIGEFEIDEILHDDIEILWETTKSFSGITRAFFFSYFKSRESGYAIKIKSYKSYDDPMELRSVYGSHPPQSFAYVDENKKRNG